MNKTQTQTRVFAAAAFALPADKDHMAHVMSDALDNVYKSCGLYTAYNYIP